MDNKQKKDTKEALDNVMLGLASCLVWQYPQHG